MISSLYRIDKHQIKDILLKSKRYNSNSFTLHILPYSKDKNSKFSFSVSKKVEKSAVKRNKLRRRGYSVLRRNLNSIYKGYLMLFVYKKTYEKDYSKLEKELLGLLSNASVII